MRKMSITNSVTAAAEFLTDSLSAFKFRSSLINEAIEKTLTDAVRERTTLEGIVVSENAQKTNLAANQQDDVYLAAKIRISAIHDEMFPSPVEFSKQNKPPEKIRQLIDAHPVLYSKDSSKEVSTSPTRGQRVSIEFIDGVPRWSVISGIDREYSRLNISYTGGVAQNAHKNKRPSLAQDFSSTPEWRRAGSNVLLNPQIESFLNQYVQDLAAAGFTTFPIVVTSGVRTPEKQAEIMVENVTNNQNWWPYGSKKLRKIIFDGIGYKLETNGKISKKTAKVGQQSQKKFIGYNISGQTPVAQYEELNRQFTQKDLIDEVVTQINANVAGGMLVSSHLSGQALDISTKVINRDTVGIDNIESTLLLMKNTAVESSGINGAAVIELYEGTKWEQQRKKRNEGFEPLSFEHLHIRIGNKYSVSD